MKTEIVDEEKDMSDVVMLDKNKLSKWYFKPGQSIDLLLKAARELEIECLKHPTLAVKILKVINETRKLQIINKQYEEWKK